MQDVNQTRSLSIDYENEPVIIFNLRNASEDKSDIFLNIKVL